MLISHDTAVGEDQTVAVNACTFFLAKLAGHLCESMHAVIVSRTTESGETAEKGQRGSVWQGQVVFRDLGDDGEATFNS